MAASASVSSDIRLLDAFWREPVRRTILPNGLTLIVKPDHSAALASVQVWVRTGSIHEGAWLGAGLSHYLEHMLFKGTPSRSARDISAQVQAKGGYMNAYTTFDRTVYHVDLPSEHTAFAIGLLADMALHSTLPAGEAAKEKEVILREIAMTRDDPDDRLWQSVFATAFREHPYRHPIIGHRDLFASLSHADLEAYYRARYAPNNLVVVVVGDVASPEVEAEVAARFGEKPRGLLAPVLVPAEPRQLAPRESHTLEEVEITRGVRAWQIPGLSHPDAPVLDLLSMVLGHGDSSILWQDIREKAGLVHTIGASTWNPGSSGLFCITYTCEPSRREAVEAALDRTLARAAARGFEPARIRQAIRQLVVDEINARKTMGGQAARLGAAEVVVGDLDYSRSYIECLRKVTPAHLRRALRTHLVPSGMTAVSTSPAGSAPAAKAAAVGGAGSIPDFEETILDNGARLLIQRDARLPNLNLRLLLGGGPPHESAGRRGASALLATLLTKDAGGRSAAEVARAIESVGGSFQPFAGNYSLGLSAEVLPPDAERALSIVSGAVLAPAFKSATVVTEREAQRAELRQDADDVVTRARKLVRRRFFGGHPLALDARGDEDGVGATGPADLSELHSRLLTGGNVVLAVAGDIPRGFERRLLAFLGKIPAGAPAARPVPPGLPGPGDFQEPTGGEQSVVLQAFPAPPLHAPDYYAGEVADELFSGMASRLFERVREEKSLAYFVRTTRVTGLDAGMFLFYAGTRPGREDEVLAEMDAEIARVAGGGVGEAEMERCRARLKAGWRQGLQTNAARAFQAGLSVLQGRPVNDWRGFDGRVDAVTSADLARLASERFRPELRTRLVVAPAKG
jgi:zinc protease